jgi:hypothetical protein
MAVYKKKASVKVTGKVKKTTAKAGTKKKASSSGAKTTVKKGKKFKGKKNKSAAGWKNSPIVGAVCGLVIIYCLYITFFAGNSSSFKKDLICHSCNAQMRMAVDYTVAEPFDCTECDKKTLYSAMKCEDCTKVTPLLPPKLDFTCSQCNHHELIVLDPTITPHPCPKCNNKTFYESYECLSCEHIFPFIRPSEAELQSQMEASDDPSMFMGDQGSTPCPKCKDAMTQSVNYDISNECVHCESYNLSEVTPYVVLKKEMSRKLSAKEQKIYDEWEAKQ